MKASAQAVFLMLARSQAARQKSIKTLRHAGGRWSVRIGGPVMGETCDFPTRRAALAAVHEHYDERLHSALWSPGWRKHLNRVVAAASENGYRMTLRRVIGIAWRRRQWLHTERHHWVTEKGRRMCSLCVSALRRPGFQD